ncbi:protein FAR1-RELATED SEQUENCE 5-like [Argentina anserina]|uniref:protein FAR1-RELATED SEQUENCE 5-like n=1 Tax=Argentina anserina TaxID=57926 RepID=UPI00217685FE|nr:protein FAR1-RELATED SEQUENCE 5-like [Potentilla anserina]
MESTELSSFELNNIPSIDNANTTFSVNDSVNGDSLPFMQEGDDRELGYDYECLMFNGKPYEDLTLDDMKNVKFASQEEIESFYAHYSLAKGFSMRKHRQGERNVSSDGFGSDPDIEYESEEDPYVDKRMRNNENGRGFPTWMKMTGHPLTRWNQKHFVRSNRVVKEHDIAQVMSLRQVSVGTARAYEFLVHQAGGQEFVGFTERDLVDESGRLANMFWRDGQSYEDYCSYGDILIFDSTYKTNIYDKPLAVFVGTNNHRGTIIFECALLADETEETYNWVLTSFLKSMNDKKPISVVTDSDEAMRNDVLTVMPEATHRLCAWHVGRNVKSHLKEEDTQKDFFHLIFAGLSIPEWEALWEYFVAMNNTQRCEGMHRNLKTDLGSCMRLYELLPRLDKTIARIRNRSLYDDYLSHQFSPVFKSHLRGMEQEIGSLFTHDVFLLIRDQIYFEPKFILTGKVPEPATGTTVICISQYGKVEKTWEVRFQGGRENPILSCSCKLFESDGIPCCHMFLAMKSENVTTFPHSLVKKRWTKESVDCVENDHNVDRKVMQLARYGELMSACAKICHIASHSDEGYDTIKEALNDLTIDARDLPQPRETDSPVYVDEATRSTGLHPNVIRDPVTCRSKGKKSKPTKGQGNVKKRRTYISVGAIVNNSPQRCSSVADGSCSSDCSDTEADELVEEADRLNSDTYSLIHNEEEAMSFDFITGVVNNNSPSRSSSCEIRDVGGDYWRFYRSFPNILP